MLFGDRKLLLTDFETTGLNPRIHEVIEIGAMRVDQQTLQVEDELEIKLIPHAIELAEPDALRVNGYSPELWFGASEPDQAWPKFLEFGRDCALISYRATFEEPFIRESLAAWVPNLGPDPRYGTLDYHFLDIPSIAWFLLAPQDKLSKDTIAELLGLPREGTVHRALAGAKHALRVLRALRAYVNSRPINMWATNEVVLH